MNLQLVVVAGPDKDCRFTLQEGPDLVLGRSPNALYHLHDPNVSRCHCQILLEGEQATVIDDGDSRDGTFVNDARVTRQPLQVGDVLKVGDTHLELQRLGQPAAPRRNAASATAAPAADETSSPLAVLCGQTLSHYEVGTMIGRGQASVVFRARDAKAGRMVALKVVYPELAQQNEEVQRFVNAVKRVMALRHPNLVTLQGAGRTGQYCWVAMELGEGESLLGLIARVREQGLLDWQPAFRVVLHVGRALDYAHQQHVLHGHMLPQNIFWRPREQRAKLSDLVLARALESLVARHHPEARLKSSTAAFLAPERLQGSEVDGRADLYSLGATAHALLTGHAPRNGAEAFPLVVPARLQRVVRTLLAPDPEERYQTAGELVTDLERLGQLQGVEV